MRIANLAGRLVLLDSDDRYLDVALANPRFSPDPQAVFDHWDEFVRWAAGVPAGGRSALVPDQLGAVVPRPRQVFAIGLNFREHGAETGLGVPAEPVVFTKYVSSFTGPFGRITLPGGDVDWEVELVVVIGRHARRVSPDDAWSYVAGVSVGQDISHRNLQFAAQPAQFGLAKSLPGFSPIGPYLVTPDELPNPDDLALGCAVNGEVVQQGRTSDMIFNVGELIARLSAQLELLPGDVIFTGTPAGVGMGMNPPRYLCDEDELTSWIEGVGQMRHRFVAARREPAGTRS